MVELLQVTHVGTSINCLRPNIAENSKYFLMLARNQLALKQVTFLKNEWVFKGYLNYETIFCNKVALDM